ncbi:MAG: ABC transporter substrate-binding protein [Actinomycetota bacterium]
MLVALTLLASACSGDGPTDAMPTTILDAAPPTTTTVDVVAATSTTTPAVPSVDFPLTILDALGREHVLGQPARLGCVTSRCREVLGGFGVAPAAAPYEPNDFYFPAGPPEFEVTDVADMEAWAGANIDFAVFGGVPAPPPSYTLVEQFVTIFYVHTPGQTNEPGMDGIDAVVWNTRALGQLLDMNDAAEADIARLRTALDAARTFSTPDLADRTFVSLANEPGYREDGTAVPGREGTFCTMLLEAGLGRCAELPTEDREIAAEVFLDLDPDIIVMHRGASSVDDRDDPVWERLTAVRNGAVFDGQGNGYRTIGVRSAIWTLQEFIHFTVPDAGIEHPGPLATFDPTTSPLVTRG